MTAGVNRHVNPWRVAGWGTAAALVLLPLIAMRFTHEVAWTASDFGLAILLIGSVGVVYELVARMTGNAAYRAAISIALLTLPDRLEQPRRRHHRRRGQSRQSGILRGSRHRDRRRLCRAAAARGDGPRFVRNGSRAIAGERDRFGRTHGPADGDRDILRRHVGGVGPALPDRGPVLRGITPRVRDYPNGQVSLRLIPRALGSTVREKA